MSESTEMEYGVARNNFMPAYVLFVLITTSFGQIHKGSVELNLFGGGTFNVHDGETSYFINIAGSGGYFVTDFLEPGLNIALSKSSGFTPALSTSAFLNFYAPFLTQRRIIPYIGGQAGFAYATGDPAFQFGGYIGTKFIIGGGHGAISLQPFYLGRKYEFGLINNFGLSTGISVFL